MKEVRKCRMGYGFLLALLVCMSAFWPREVGAAAESATPSPSATAEPTELTKPEAPVITSVTTSEKGIWVKFSKVEDADLTKYVVYQCYEETNGDRKHFLDLTTIAASQYDKVMADGGAFIDIESGFIRLGATYELVVIAQAERPVKEYYNGKNITVHHSVYSDDSNVAKAYMPQRKVLGVNVEAVNNTTTELTWVYPGMVQGYEIQCSTSEDGPYYVAAVLHGTDISSWKHENLQFGTTYYYRVYGIGTASKSYTATTVKCKLTFAKPKRVKSKMLGPKKMKVTWRKVDGAQGYIVYRSVTENSKRKGSFKKYKVLKGESKTSLTVPNVSNGTCYHYKIVAYMEKDGVTIEGKPAKHSRYADYYGHKNETKSSRKKRIYGNRKQEYRYRTSGKYMKTIRVKVWDFAKGQSGRKVTKVKTIRVHKNIAPTVKKIFQEIYKGKERATIYKVVGHSSRTNQHVQGVGIDLNTYSVKPNGDIVKAFRKYGFSGGVSRKQKDDMYFSYMGT
nr:fibronectin type III domain-containing protein [Eubacterium sp.]